jgi:outer membrane protein OmpA-like peptidoglycan-associated protein
VTVVQRSTKAINYQYRSGPTRIDFRGTVLLPQSKGDAVVESRQGRTEIDARFENLSAPIRFGREYLTYVLWALTPDGRPHNIGEVIPSASDKAHLRVTTDLQAFALIVTAEPYAAVRRPGDVVVLENQVRPDTTGKIEEVTARYELMPRGHYSWLVPDTLESSASNTPKVSMHKYEELLELYQAQNAVGIARAGYAEDYAPNTFAKAQQLLTEAQQLERSKADSKRVVQIAREAAEAAEDARVIAERRQQDEKLVKAQAEASRAQQARVQAEAEAQQAKIEAEAARARADAERAARQRVEAEAGGTRERVEVPAPPRPSSLERRPPEAYPQRSTTRMRLLEQLNAPLPTRDTPRGLVATIPGSDFDGTALRGQAAEQIGRVASVIAAHPGLRVEVEGHTESPDKDGLSRRRAEAVRDALVRRGLPATIVTARGLGNSRPLYANTTAGGREENQRVEIVISGDPIGSLPFWDRTYSLAGRGGR